MARPNVSSPGQTCPAPGPDGRFDDLHVRPRRIAGRAWALRAPYFIAPSQQTHIPFVLWLGREAKARIEPSCVVAKSVEPQSHDNGRADNEFPAGDGSKILVHEPAKQSCKPAKLDLLALEPGDQPAVGNRGGCIAAIKRVCPVDDGVIARIGGMRACGLRSLGPDWIARHQSSAVSEVIF